MFALPETGLGTVIYVGIFLGVLLVFEGLRQILARGEVQETARNRRMKMIAGGATPEQVLQILKPSAERWSLESLPLVGDLPEVLRQAGVTLRPQTFLILSTAACVMLALGAAPILGLGLSGLIGLCLGLFAPVGIVRSVGKKRMDRLTQQLPDALELMSRGLRVGHPLSTTIQSVARDMADPIASEFGVMVDQVAYGEDIVGAFADFAERVGTEDARYLATSVAIQNGTGSDLAHVLVTLSKVIRGRIQMRRKIMAISAEGRATAVFMSMLPFIIMAMSVLTSPDYYPGVMDDPLFKPLAAIAMGLIVANYLVLRKLVNFQI